MKVCMASFASCQCIRFFAQFILQTVSSMLLLQCMLPLLAWALSKYAILLVLEAMFLICWFIGYIVTLLLHMLLLYTFTLIIINTKLSRTLTWIFSSRVYWMDTMFSMVSGTIVFCNIDAEILLRCQENFLSCNAFCLWKYWR